MFTGVPTENQEMFRAASSGEYVYIGYFGIREGKQIAMISKLSSSLPNN
jgi:hypothetical protein